MFLILLFDVITVPDVPRYVLVSNEDHSTTIHVYWGYPQVFKGKILYFEVSIGNSKSSFMTR